MIVHAAYWFLACFGVLVFLEGASAQDRTNRVAVAQMFCGAVLVVLGLWLFFG